MKVVPNLDDLSSAGGNEQVQEIRATLLTKKPYERSVELLKKFADKDLDPYRMAYSNGVNLTTLCEMLDPSAEHQQTSLDAFERLLRASGIRMQSDPSRGIWASKLEDLEKSRATKLLIPELISRFYRGAVNNSSDARASSSFLSSDYVLNSIMRPYATRAGIVTQPLIAPIPVSAVVAKTTGINTDSYRGFYIDQNAEAQKMKRVTELGEIPRTKIKGREQAVSLYKYGRAIEMSYETMRRMSIDMVAILIQLMALQAENDKLEEAIGVLVNGDGNSNAATVFNLTTLDAAATPPNLTLKAYVNYQLKFESPYQLNLMLMQSDVAAQLLLLNTGSANIPLMMYAGLAGFGGVRLINRTSDNIPFGFTTLAPASKILGIDTRLALEHVYEIGASISETDRFITRQSEVLTLTETEGWAILDKDARKLLNLLA
jgi:hypothetical protein